MDGGLPHRSNLGVSQAEPRAFLLESMSVRAKGAGSSLALTSSVERVLVLCESGRGVRRLNREHFLRKGKSELKSLDLTDRFASRLKSRRLPPDAAFNLRVLAGRVRCNLQRAFSRATDSRTPKELDPVPLLWGNNNSHGAL